MRKIADAALTKGLWRTSEETPRATVAAALYSDLKHKGAVSTFVKVGPGTFGLREFAPSPSSEGAEPGGGTPTFLDAAEHVLKEVGKGRPMHYRDITSEALCQRWIATQGQTPKATMYAQILTDIRRREAKGLRPRLVKRGKGLIALAEKETPAVEALIRDRNREVERALKKALHKMDWADFEELVAELFGEMGFEEVEITSKRFDYHHQRLQQGRSGGGASPGRGAGRPHRRRTARTSADPVRVRRPPTEPRSLAA